MSTRRPIRADHWRRRLTALADEHQVPGAALGILGPGPDGTGEVLECATGVLNTRTGVAVTPDSLFQIGSITKVWTATIALQLVEEGRLDLDAPVRDVLPELVLADAATAEHLTMRHLLTHTSGIDGDVFTDTGRGEDCLERYVAHLASAAQTHPLGATHSYCNSGYVIAGRVIEKLTGLTWDHALQARLVRPLGLTHTFTQAEEAILHRVAVGHLGSEATPATRWALPRSVGPGGSIISTVGDVLTFARLHLLDGATVEGIPLLGQDRIQQMAAFQAPVPDKRTLGDSWGLGWIRFSRQGHRLIGHDGSTIGQSALLRILPSHGVAVVALANGGRTHNLFADLVDEILTDLADISAPKPLAPPSATAGPDLRDHIGTYRRSGVRIEVLVRDDVPILRHTATGELAFLSPEPEEFELVPGDGPDGEFLIRREQEQRWLPVTFYRLPTGEQYLHLGGRATPKVA